MFVASEVPPGTGLGSSSTTSVTLCNICSTLTGQAMSKKQLADLAYEIETQRLEAPIGKQDQYAAAFGGLNCFEFSSEEVRVTPLAMNITSVRSLERRIMPVCLLYTSPPSIFFRSCLLTKSTNKSEKKGLGRSPKKLASAMTQAKVLAKNIQAVIPVHPECYAIYLAILMKMARLAQNHQGI